MIASGCGTAAIKLSVLHDIELDTISDSVIYKNKKEDRIAAK